ncbi:Spc98 family-domain-containing protein [Syncephalis plumigaleata]|nr:Spc98 family-domain-containing protein [Syncephalis plumigaleata]
MTQRVKDVNHFTHELITLFIGAERGTSDYKQCWKFIQTELNAYRYSQVDSTQCKQRYTGLAEKMSAHSQQVKVNTLLASYTRLFQLWHPVDQMLPHNVLFLLLELSQSPTNAAYSPSSMASNIVNYQKLTWEDIVKESPLKGEHWEIPSYTSDTEDDYESDYEVAVTAVDPTSNINKHRTTQQQQQQQQDNIASNNNLIVRREQYRFILDRLVQQQYWRLKSSNLMSTTAFEFYKADTLAPTLNRMMRESVEYLPLQCENYITERDLIREVLFMLMGRSCFLFKHEDRMIKILNEAQLKHLSQGGLLSLLKSFASNGAMIHTARTYALTILTMGTEPKSRVSEAFAAAIYDELVELDRVLSQLEQVYINDDMKSDIVISLLRLESTLKERFILFHELGKILDCINTEDAAIYATSILDQLYYTAEHQLYLGSTGIYYFMQHLWRKSLVPYLEIMYIWLCNGELDDEFNEFAIKRNTDVSLRSSQYWSNGFVLKPTHNCCPSFFQPVIQSILITGKMRCLLRQIDTQTSTDTSSDWMNTFKQALEQQQGKDRSSIEYTISTTVNEEGEYNNVLQHMFPVHSSTLPTLNDTRTSSEASNVSHSDTSKHDNVDQWIPLTARLASAFDALVVAPRENTSRLLLDTLINKHHLWRKFDGLFGFYYMLAGQSWHRFCDALFTKMDSESMWADRQFINHLLIDAIYDDVNLDERCVSAWIRTTTDVDFDQDIRVLQILDFDYSIPWPINNIIRPTSFSIYRKITNLLLQVRRARYLIERPEYFKYKFIREDVTSGLFYALRMRLLAFTHGFYNYLMTTVLHSESQRILKEMKESMDIDIIIQLYEQHTLLVRDRCLLNEKATIILQSVLSLLEACSQLRRLFRQYVIVSDRTLRSMPGFHDALTALASEFERTRSFVETSLRVIARAGGFQHLEVLALLIAN